MNTTTRTDVDAVEGVLNAIATYAHALDDGRTEDVVALFTIDGTSEIAGYGSFTGHDALRGAYANLVPQQPQRHMTGNTVVTVIGPESATATSDFVLFGRGEAGWASLVVGSYQDTLRRSVGGWIFSERRTSFIM